MDKDKAATLDGMMRASRMLLEAMAGYVRESATKIRSTMQWPENLQAQHAPEALDLPKAFDHAFKRVITKPSVPRSRLRGKRASS